MSSKGKVKRSFRWLIFVGIIAVAVITNPDKDTHIEKINDKLFDLVPDMKKTSIIKEIGKLVSNPILDEIISFNNYYLFSITKVEILGESEKISYGFFGMVFFTEKVKEIDSLL